VGAAWPARAATAVVLAVVVAVDLLVLPLSFWAGYVHEGAWGFRTSGAAGWAYDWAVATVPAWIAVAFVVLVGYALVRRLPRAWPPVAGLAAAGATALVVFAAPLLLEPLQFRMTDLGPGPVRDAVTAVVDRSGQRVDRILVADASRRTTKHNAYLSGLGTTRRVVLYDTLVEARPPGEVAVILAHELGHQRNGDLPRGALFGGAGVVAVAYVLALLVRRRSAAGLQRGQADPRAAAVLLAVVAVLNVVSLPVQSLASRRAEAAADLAALEFTRDPGTYVAMNLQLGRSNLSNPAPPSWVRLLWSTHPPTAHRVTLGEWWAEQHGVEQWSPAQKNG
jgi:STE24 endopeptidase